jgi:Zn-finger in ubiquitin-hydrolases and other protein
LTCQHLSEAADPEPQTPFADGCPECVAGGFHDWVHLRVCLTCGRVACCDSSPRRHMSAHFEADGHPVMRSYEPGETWRWCFVDDLLG